MNLISFFKSFFFLQNLAAWLCSKIPPTIEHNLAKYTALRKAFYLTALDGTIGDYLEFGVFTGSSLVFAAKYASKLKPLTKGNTRFFGFDSFEGFGEINEYDSHPFYLNETFAVNFAKVRKNIENQTKGADVKLIKGFFNQTLKDRSALELGIEKARIIFIDCDLMEPATDVFKFVNQVIQPGTILIMDDFYNYKGSRTLGLAGAFEKFCTNNPNLSWRQVTDYGFVGVVMICSKT
jgi:O-methyltransferase